MRKHLIAVGLASTLLLSACGSSGSPKESGGDSPTDTKELVIGQIETPSAFDLSGYATGNKTQYFTAVYDTILRQDGDGNIVPGIATDYSYDETRTELTLTIREGVEFTDDTPVNADAVAKNIEAFRNSSTPDLSNAEFIESVSAPDATTVVLKLSAPDPMMLHWLTQPLGFLSSPESWDNPDVATNPVGSGPYILDTEATVVGSTYVFEKNPNYWDKDLGQWDNLKFVHFADSTALLNALQGGQLDASTLSNVPLSALPQVESAGYGIDTSQLDWMGLMLLDRDGVASEPLGDVRVRQAINYAIDREGMLQALQLGKGSVSTQIFGPSTGGFNADLNSAYPFDPEKARSLMAEAGYGDGFTLEMPSASLIDTAVLTQIQQQLKDIGITVNYTDVGTNFISELMAAKFPASWMQLASASDWQTAAFAITPTALFNAYKTDSPEVAPLLEVMQKGSTEEAVAAAQELNAYLVDQAWFAPFYFIDNNFASKPNVDVTMAADMAVPYMYLIQPAK